MRPIRIASRLLLPLLLSALVPACDIIESDKPTHVVVIESGTDSNIIRLPILPKPPGSITCALGTGVGREEVLGPEGGTVRLDPPLTRRRIGVHAYPNQSASRAPFTIAEMPIGHPEVEVTAPAGRAIRVTMSAKGCEFGGQLGIYRWDGREWGRQPEVSVSPDSVVSVELESASRYAMGTF